MVQNKSSKEKNELLKLMNVGPAAYKDLQLLEIHSISQLASACADELYARLQRITKQSHDLCVWDVFAAAIYEARTGTKQPWWEWTKIRKKRQLEGTFCI